jgi:hypothetical protein
MESLVCLQIVPTPCSWRVWPTCKLSLSPVDGVWPACKLSISPMVGESDLQVVPIFCGWKVWPTCKLSLSHVDGESGLPTDCSYLMWLESGRPVYFTYLLWLEILACLKIVPTCCGWTVWPACRLSLPPVDRESGVPVDCHYLLWLESLADL